MRHLVPSHHPADVEQRVLAAARVGDRAVPLRPAPSVKEVNGSPPYAGEVLERLLQGPAQLLVVAGVDGGPDVGGRLAVEVGVAEEAVDARRGVDQVCDQAAEGGKGGAVAVAQLRLVHPVDEVAGPLRDRAEKQDDIRRGHLLVEFHRGSKLKPLSLTSPRTGEGPTLSGIKSAL